MLAQVVAHEPPERAPVSAEGREVLALDLESPVILAARAHGYALVPSTISP